MLVELGFLVNATNVMRHASYVIRHPFGSSRLTFEALTEKLKSLAKIL